MIRLESGDGINEKQLTLLAAASAAYLLFISVVIMFFLPSSVELVDGYMTPVIAFQFAQDTQNLWYMMGDSASAAMHRENSITGLYMDMTYPFGYATMLFFLHLRSYISTYKWALVGVPFALLAIPTDMMENTTMINIVNSLEAGQVSQALFDELYLNTRLKWGTIGLSILVMGVTFYKEQAIKRAVLAGLTSLSVFICFITGPIALAAEFMFMCIGVFFTVVGVMTLLEAGKLLKNQSVSKA